MDIEDDGYLSFEEFKKCFKKFFLSFKNADDDLMEELFDEIDRDKDDKISFEEF